MLTSWRRYAANHPRLVEAVFLLTLFAAAGPASQLSSQQYAQGTLGTWPGVPLAAVACLALLWRRRHPQPVVVVTAICASAAGGMGYLITPLLLAPVMVALYELALRVPRRTAQAYCLGVIALIVGTALLSDRLNHPWALKTISPAFWLLLPVALGTAAEARRALLEAVRARAEHAEHTREEEARHRVAEERVRIARELHDVVAHHLALANAQAGTAAHLARSRPEQVEKILTELAATTASALRELKATVGLLRRPDDPDSPLEPAPGLARLPELISALGTAGLQVSVTVEGDAKPLSPGVDLTAYRIIQEALTNVTKHAVTATAEVRLSYSGELLTITVSDNGDVSDLPSDSGGGFGLIGMRERAQSAGGRLQAGRRPEGGFTVTAELPIHF